MAEGVSHSMSYEVRVSIESEEATVYSSDKAVAQLPTSVLSRSAVLQQAIRDVDQDELITLNLPGGVLGAWLAGLDLLDVDWRVPRLPRGNEHLHKPKGHLELLKCLKAADFLDDKAALTGLCRHAFQQIFDPFIRGYDHIDVKVARDVCGLSSHLQQAVLASSRVLLGPGVRLLPEPLLEAAVHALHPSITTSSSITIPSDEIDGIYGKACFQVVAKSNWLQKLCIEFVGVLPQHALQTIQQLTQLLSLTMRWTCKDVKTTKRVVKALSGALQNLTALEHLNLCGNDLRGVGLAASVVKLTRLKSLDLTRCVLESAGIQALAKALPQLPSLAFIVIDGSLQDAECTIPYEHHLCHCSHLTELHILGISDAWHALQGANSFPDLQHLEMIDVICTAALSDTLQKLTALRVLKIKYNDILYNSEMDSHLALLTAQCLGSFAMLQELDIRFTVEQDSVKWLQVLRSQISKLGQLSILDFTGYDILRDRGTAVADLACSCRALQVLHVKEKFARTGVMQPLRIDFMSRLLSIRSLQHLQIGLERRVMLGFLKAFHNPAAKQLRSLSLHSILRDDLQAADDYPPAKNLQAALVDTLPTLRHLDLGHSVISNIAVLSLSNVIGAMTALQSLSLCSAHIEYMAWPAIASKLSKLVTLQKLDMRLSLESFVAGPCGVSVAEHLACITWLRQLYFPSQWVDGYRVRVLGPAIGKLTDLQELSVGSRERNTYALERLAPYIMNLSSVRMVDLVDSDRT